LSSVSSGRTRPLASVTGAPRPGRSSLVATYALRLMGDEFRHELRERFRRHHPGPPPKDSLERLAWQRAYCATAVDHGLAGPSWPREHGGMELTFEQQVIYAEEAARARVPRVPGTGVGIAGPTIIRYGTEAQKQRFLRPMLRADVIWAQGYSEPGAGSDLPSLRTAATRDGDRYVVNGQKVWSSHADIADILFTLVRTGPPESGRDGITYLLVDAHAPGVTIRPLRDMTGSAGFCEVFFDDVEVPVAQRIGEEHGGWHVARTSLGHERAAGSLTQARFYDRIVGELATLARDLGRADDPVVRQELASLAGAQRIMTLNASRTIATIVRDGEPGPGSSTSRLVNTQFEQRLHEFAIELLGPYGALDRADAHAPERGRWAHGFLRTRASTIGAGTAEIQRNTIAERVLGLPHD
jgi:alkylation response protein AidB-like acyl-CoA dehydrogenase